MKEIEVTMHEFKTHLSAFAQKGLDGEYERIILKKNKTPVGYFIPITEEKPKKFQNLDCWADEFKNYNWDDWKAADREVEEMFYENADDLSELLD